MEWCELLCLLWFPIMLKGSVYKSYSRPAILYLSDVWWLSENEAGIFRRMERSMVKAMCGVQLQDTK